MNKDMQTLNTLYRVITESPDGILMKTDKGSYHIYYNDSDTIACMIYPNGQYVVSNDKNINHGELVADILDSDKRNEDVAIIHNFGDNYFAMFKGYYECRIWPHQKVFSMWKPYNPVYVEGVINAIKAAGLNPEGFVFDTRDHSYDLGKQMTYKEFVNRDISTEDKFKQAELDKQDTEERQLAARVKAGEFKQSKDPDMPSFYKRGGD